MANRAKAILERELLETIGLVQEIVEEFASCKVIPQLPTNFLHTQIRIAPGFRRNADPRAAAGRIIYTISHVQDALLERGKDMAGSEGRANQMLCLALAILEGIEERWLSEAQILQVIAEAKTGFVNRLLRELKAQRQHWLSTKQTPYEQYIPTATADASVLTV